MDKQKILFVRGFATALSSGIDDYIGIKTVLEQHYDFTYFDYEPSEALDVVYKRMYKIINSMNPDILIAHSLGGGLVTKYIKSNTETINKDMKIILLMPLLCKSAFIDIMIQILSPSLLLNPQLLLPKPLLLNPMDIYEGGNILNCDISLISFKQVYDIFTEPNSIVTNDLSFISNNPKIKLFYASNEKINIIDESILQKIPTKQLKRVLGLHECWRSITINNNRKTDFFSQLLECLESND